MVYSKGYTHFFGSSLEKICREISKIIRNKIKRIKFLLFFTGISNRQILNPSAQQNSLFFFDEKKKDEIIEIIKSKYPDSIQITINDANQICRHIFDLLGSGKVNLEGRIDWHVDFKTGQQWEHKTFYTDIEIVKTVGSDIKVPWELSRFHHLVTLGKAYWYTKDEKYVKEFIAQINDWLNNNPPQFGINWACTMEVSIRVVNWIWGYYFFKDSKLINKEFLIKFLKSILIHGKHIIENLENRKKVSNNHYLSDLTGLIYIWVLFPKFKEAKKWQEFALQQLIKEMKRQVYQDGVNFESSINYHRLAVELFFYPTILCLKNKINFPDWYMEQLEKMIEFVMYYTKPDGTAPMIGDNDDGRVHILTEYTNWNRWNHKYLLSIGAVLFNRADFKKQANEFKEEAFWLLGKEGLDRFDSINEEDEDIEEIGSKAFTEGGLYIMRKGNLYMIIDCGPHGQEGNGGHAHNDTLGFEIYAGDKGFLIDPSTYIYTGDTHLRNLFRSTAYHNTVVVDKEEMNRFSAKDIFSMQEDAIPKVNQWEVSSKYDLLNAQHNGYERLKEPIVHQRKVLFNKAEGYWIIQDLLTGKGEHDFDLYFHFAPIELEFISQSSLAVKTKCKGTNILLFPLEIKGLKISMEEGWISYSYGTKIKAPVIEYSIFSKAPISFTTIIFPFEGQTPILENIKNDIMPFYEKVLER